MVIIVCWSVSGMNAWTWKEEQADKKDHHHHHRHHQNQLTNALMESAGSCWPIHIAEFVTKSPPLPHRHLFMPVTVELSQLLLLAAAYRHDCVPAGYALKSFLNAAAEALEQVSRIRNRGD